MEVWKYIVENVNSILWPVIGIILLITIITLIRKTRDRKLLKTVTSVKRVTKLKEEEQQRHSLEWNVSRTLAKVNYRIHTDAIKDHLIPPKLSKKQTRLVYASEADLLNMALFGKTAADWRKENPDKDGNIHDHAMLEQ